MNQRGVTFLEIIVVVGILAVTSMLVAPSIEDWRQKRALEADFHAVLSKIDYVKTRTRNLGGAAVLICTPKGNGSSMLTYQISTNPQTSVTAVDTVDEDGNKSTFADKVVEDPSAMNANFNVLSGNTVLLSPICNGTRGIFASSGQSGVEGSGVPISIEIDPLKNKSKYGAYRITLYQSTGFIQKEKWSIALGQFQELD